jgi:hypothetical protein
MLKLHHNSLHFNHKSMKQWRHHIKLILSKMIQSSRLCAPILKRKPMQREKNPIDSFTKLQLSQTLSFY